MQGPGIAGGRLRPEEERGQEAAEPLPFFAFPAGVRRRGASRQTVVCRGGPTGLAALEKERVGLGWPGGRLRLFPWGYRNLPLPAPAFHPPSSPTPRYSFPAPEGPGFLGKLSHRILLYI